MWPGIIKYTRTRDGHMSPGIIKYTRIRVGHVARYH